MPLNFARGFTMVPNEALELLAAGTLTLAEFACLVVALRHIRANGAWPLAASFVAAGAGVSKPTAIAALDKLCRLEILQEVGMQGQTKVYGLAADQSKSRVPDAADETWTPPVRQPRPRMVGEEPWTDTGTPRQRRERYLRMIRGAEPRTPRNVSEWYIYHSEVEQPVKEAA